MGDIFKEQLVKKEKNNKDTLKQGGIIVGAIALFLILSTFQSIPLVSAIFPFIFLGLLVGAYMLFTFMNVEYEYVYTNGELDVDRITNKARRKRIFSADVRTIEIMAHAEDKDYDSEFKNVQKTMDLSSGKIKPNTYFVRVPYEGKMVKVILEPNDAILTSMSQVLTQRKFHVKK